MRTPEGGIPQRAWIGGLFAVFVLCLATSASAADVEPLPLGLRPCQVELGLAVDLPLLSTNGRENLRGEILEAARRCLGQQWNVTVVEEPGIQPVSAEGLTRCAAAQDQTDRHRVLVAVHQTGAGIQIDVRAEQAITGVSDIVSETIYDRRELAVAIVRGCYLAVRPVAVVDSVDGTTARLILQAGELIAPDESLSIDATCRLFEPMLVLRSRDGLIERVQPIPWTVLKVESRAGGQVTCEVWSGLRSPLGGKQSGRVQVMAFGIRPQRSATRLELVTQSRPVLPLVAHRIELRTSSAIPRPDDEGEDETLLQTLLTDRRGYVTLPRGDHEVLWAFTYSGRQLLARVPVVPGQVAVQRLEVPDDSARLAAEAALARLQGQVVEAVAERNTAAARVRAAVKKNQKDAASAAAADLRALPDVQVYLDRVTEIRVPAIKAAQSRRDRAGEVRIGRMCDDLAELIKLYLSEDKRRAVFEELKELSTDDPDSEVPGRVEAKPVAQ